MEKEINPPEVLRYISCPWHLPITNCAQCTVHIISNGIIQSIFLHTRCKTRCYVFPIGNTKMHFSLLFPTFIANLGRERFSFIKIASDSGWKISSWDPADPPGRRTRPPRKVPLDQLIKTEMDERKKTR